MMKSLCSNGLLVFDQKKMFQHPRPLSEDIKAVFSLSYFIF